MKNTLTFIYGILLILFAIGICPTVNELNTFWDYIILICAMVLIVAGFNKLDKSTL